MPDLITHEARTGRRSWLGYARIFRSIHDGIDTAATLAPIHGLRTEAQLVRLANGERACPDCYTETFNA